MSLEARRAQDGRWQEHWYRHAAEFCRGRSVLDVGAGSGYGLDILAGAGARMVVGCDPLPLRDDVQPHDEQGWEPGSFDYVLAIDVIEHIENDVAFLATLERIAARGVFISTPNWNATRCANAHHVREYTPDELLELLGPRKFTAWTSDAYCKTTPGFNRDAPNFGVLIQCG